MEKIKQKLTSRKLWAAILVGMAALVAGLFGGELSPETVAALRCAVTAAVAYIFGEGAVDAVRLLSAALGGVPALPAGGEGTEENPETE